MTPQQVRTAGKIRAFLARGPRGSTEGGEETIGLLRETLEALDPELPPYENVDISNRFLLAVTGAGTSKPLFNFTLRPTPMDADEALVVAAWLITLADPLGERFPTIERMVHNA